MKNLYLITFLILFMLSGLYSQTASEIIEKADNKLRGSSSYTELVITIVRPKWEKKMTLKSWSIGSDFSSTLVTSPAKEKGTVFLKRNNEIWNYLPSLERTVKFPPSMMTQSWMGTDFTTDDLVKQSSTVTDYSHKILAEEDSAKFVSKINKMDGNNIPHEDFFLFLSKNKIYNGEKNIKSYTQFHKKLIKEIFN